MNGIYVRWKRGEPREGRIFPPLEANHPAMDKPCANPACPDLLGDETPVQLLAIGPNPSDPEDVERHRAGRWYNAVATLAHARCLGNNA